MANATTPPRPASSPANKHANDRKNRSAANDRFDASPSGISSLYVMDTTGPKSPLSFQHTPMRIATRSVRDRHVEALRRSPTKARSSSPTRQRPSSTPPGRASTSLYEQTMRERTQQLKVEELATVHQILPVDRQRALGDALPAQTRSTRTAFGFHAEARRDDKHVDRERLYLLQQLLHERNEQIDHLKDMIYFLREQNESGVRIGNSQGEENSLLERLRRAEEELRSLRSRGAGQANLPAAPPSLPDPDILSAQTSTQLQTDEAANEHSDDEKSQEGDGIARSFNNSAETSMSAPQSAKEHMEILRATIESISSGYAIPEILETTEPSVGHLPSYRLAVLVAYIPAMLRRWAREAMSVQDIMRLVAEEAPRLFSCSKAQLAIVSHSDPETATAEILRNGHLKIVGARTGAVAEACREQAPVRLTGDLVADVVDSSAADIGAERDTLVVASHKRMDRSFVVIQLADQRKSDGIPWDSSDTALAVTLCGGLCTLLAAIQHQHEAEAARERTRELAELLQLCGACSSVDALGRTLARHAPSAISAATCAMIRVDRTSNTLSYLSSEVTLTSDRSPALVALTKRETVRVHLANAENLRTEMPWLTGGTPRHTRIVYVPLAHDFVLCYTYDGEAPAVTSRDERATCVSCAAQLSLESLLGREERAPHLGDTEGESDLLWSPDTIATDAVSGDVRHLSQALRAMMRTSRWHSGARAAANDRAGTRTQPSVPAALSAAIEASHHSTAISATLETMCQRRSVASSLSDMAHLAKKLTGAVFVSWLLARRDEDRWTVVQTSAENEAAALDVEAMNMSLRQSLAGKALETLRVQHTASLSEAVEGVDFDPEWRTEIEEGTPDESTDSESTAPLSDVSHSVQHVSPTQSNGRTSPAPQTMPAALHRFLQRSTLVQDPPKRSRLPPRADSERAARDADENGSLGESSHDMPVLVILPVQSYSSNTYLTLSLAGRAGWWREGEGSDTALRALTAAAHVALRLREQQEALHTVEQRGEALLGIAEAFVSVHDLDRLVTLIMDRARRLLQCDRCSLFVVDRDAQELWSRIANGTHEIRIPIDKGIAGSVATSGTTLNIADAYSDDRFNQSVDRATGYRTNSILCVPVRNENGDVIAVTQMINKLSGKPFDQEDERLLNAFSVFSGIALANAKILSHERARVESLEHLFESFVSLHRRARVRSTRREKLRRLLGAATHSLGAQVTFLYIPLALHNDVLSEDDDHARSILQAGVMMPEVTEGLWAQITDEQVIRQLSSTDGVIQMMSRSRRPWLVSSFSDSYTSKVLLTGREPDDLPRNALLVPVFSNETDASDIVAILQCENKRQGAFDDNDAAILSMYGQLLL